MKPDLASPSWHLMLLSLSGEKPQPLHGSKRGRIYACSTKDSTDAKPVRPAGMQKAEGICHLSQPDTARTEQR